MERAFHASEINTLVNNAGSAWGLYAVPMLSVYYASKLAVEGFSESLSYELASVADGTSRLHYLAGKDVVPFVEARQETSEAAYSAFMRKTFASVVKIGD